jgi:hypothetical protein
MKTIMLQSMEEFVENKRLRQHYTERQLEALYELLKDKRLGPSASRFLENKDLIIVEYRESEIEGLLKGYYRETTMTIETIGDTL